MPTDQRASSLFDLSELITDDDIRKARLCGRGGFGDVYAMDHPVLGKIAVKRLREEVRSIAEAAEDRRVSESSSLPFCFFLTDPHCRELDVKLRSGNNCIILTS